tara:strand:+ start:3981 stop:4778 length:798 start_codon:yes stop_codon:yes gene_type:complete
MKILLTGNRGFIGSNLVLQVRDNNELDFIEQNDYDKTNNIPEKVRWCDVVAHIGAVADTLENDVNYMMKNNWLHSKELFDLAHEHSKKVVFASSAAIYGNDKDYLNPYAWSKHIAESYGLEKVNNFISLRYFNVYGPGEGHKGKMASMAHHALVTGKIKLFQGKPQRDFVYIKDVIGATKNAILETHASGIYDVGTGEARTFEDMMDALSVPYEYLYKPEGRTPPHYQMHTCAKKENWLKNWEPKYMLEAGLKEYKEWFKKQLPS